MRKLGFSLLMLLVAGCATVNRPEPLTSEEVVALAKSGKTSKDIIEEIKRTDTVIPLSASEIVRLSAAGVPTEVLDHLQRAQIDEIRWRDRYSQYYWGPMYRGLGPCPWPTLDRRTRGWGWPC